MTPVLINKGQTSSGKRLCLFSSGLNPKPSMVEVIDILLEWAWHGGE